MLRPVNDKDRTMTTTTSPADVPLWQLTAALDELFILRQGAAYEAVVIIATLGMKLPTGCRDELNTAKAILLDCTRGDVVKHKATSKQVDAWLATVPSRTPISDSVVDHDVLAHLVGDINFLRRRLAAYPAYTIYGALTYSGMPDSRRGVHVEQRERLSSLTNRKTRDPWAGVGHSSMSYAWREHGNELLTRPIYEAEIAKRW